MIWLMSDARRPDPDADMFRPPAIPTEVYCPHCRKEYQSYLIRWEEEVIDGKTDGYWSCPTPGCEGKGFGFDIFPTDREWRDENGDLMWVGDAADEEEDNELNDDEIGDNFGEDKSQRESLPDSDEDDERHGRSNGDRANGEKW